MADQDVTSFATGLSQALSGYLGQNISSQQAIQQKQQESDIEANKEIKVAKAKNDMQPPSAPDAQMSPDMAEKILPGAGANLVQAFQKQNNRLPTMSEAKEYLSQAASNIPDTNKSDTHQDQLEKQAMDRITQVRGDQSLMRAEHQRDSAGMAYDTIAKAESENRPLTELEQTDLVGQLWQARTGKAPTDNDMKLLNDRTAKRGFNHMVTYLTGDPSIVGASTDDTLKNLKQFVTSTGSKADQQWEAYMNPRMVKPTGLDEDRWDHIKTQNRGIPFKDQKATSDKTYKVKQGVGGAGRVTVVGPDGRKGTIPASQLEDALKAGYKQG